MKKVLALLVLTTGLYTANAQTPVPAAATEPAQLVEKTADEVVDGPHMKFETTEIDYGTIKQNSEPLRVFKFENAGTEPLVIKHAKGSCGCTVPSYPKQPILPGETATIEVRYDTKRIGNFQKTVTLTTNEADEKHVLTIKGKVNPAAAKENMPKAPKSMIN